MTGLLKFDSLITPSIAKFLFYLGVVLSVLIALSIIGSGVSLMRYQGFLGFLYIIGGLLAVLIGIVISRVSTEMILVLFMIRDELAWQRQRQQTPSPVETGIARDER